MFTYVYRVTVDDLLLFYATSPVRGVVSVAHVESKAEENNVLWRDEAVVGRVIYQYRITFKPVFVLNEDKWGTDRIVVKDLNVSVRAGLTVLGIKTLWRGCWTGLGAHWGLRFRKAFFSCCFTLTVNSSSIKE